MEHGGVVVGVAEEEEEVGAAEVDRVQWREQRALPPTAEGRR